MPAPRDIRRQQQRSRSLLQSLSRAILEESGQRLAAARAAEHEELTALGVHVRTAINAGLSVTEISELTGLSRRKIYELRAENSAEELSTRVLIHLAAHGGQSPVAIAAELGDLDRRAVGQALDDLQSQGFVRVAFTQYDKSGLEPHLLITPEGEAQLETILNAGGRHKRMTVYIPFDSSDREKIQQAAIKTLGEDFAIVEPMNADAMGRPELAFTVTAQSAQHAASIATERMNAIRDRAKLPSAATSLLVVEG